MDQYLTRARRALADIDAAAGGLLAAAGRLPADVKLPPGKAARLHELARSIPDRSAKIRFSLDLTEKTAVDIVDLQARLEGLSASLAADLASLGDLVEKTPAAAAALKTELCALEERAERVAAALFPNAIEGLREINRTLWDFRPIALEYERAFAGEVARTKNRLTAAQLDAVRATSEALTARFDDVNELLNRLATTSVGDSATVKAVIRQARRALGDAVKGATSRAGSPFKPFHGVLGKAERLARKIDRQFAELRVPVFPSTDGLEQIDALIDHQHYDELVGVERMALLNIAARLRSIRFGSGADDHLLSPRFGLRIFEVFPDRIYFEADRTFITTIAGLAATGAFAEAPASLHRFNEGSYKQTVSRKGNLQVSYAGTPSSAGRDRVNVDADIDLYRGTIRHLFGEVLVNHLTGSTTDQFKVWDILASSRVAPIAGFDLVTV